MLSEYVEELKSTDKFQADPKASFEAIYADWAKNYAYEKGQFILYEPVGCEACRGTGYQGRVALHELLRGTDAIKKDIQEHARMWDDYGHRHERWHADTQAGWHQESPGRAHQHACGAGGLHQVAGER